MYVDHVAQGAEIGSDGGNDHLIPTIFELQVQDILSTGLRPAFVSLFQSLSRQHPQLQFFHNYANEFYFFGLYHLQKNYLLNKDASFAENFYGLVRRTIDGEKLNSRDKFKALLTLTLYPYLRFRLQQICEAYKGVPIPKPDESATWKEKLRYYIIIGAPMLETFLNFMYFFYSMKYLFGTSASHSLILKLLGQKLQRMTMSDIKDFQSKTNALDFDWANTTFVQKLTYIASRAGSTFAQTFHISMLLFLYGYRLAEWLTIERDNLITHSKLPIPPPPPNYPSHPEGITIPNDSTLCPLCRRKRENPVALNPGFVYCFRCIAGYIDQHQKCPITFLPAKKTDIRRLFED